MFRGDLHEIQEIALFDREIEVKISLVHNSQRFIVFLVDVDVPHVNQRGFFHLKHLLIQLHTLMHLIPNPLDIQRNRPSFTFHVAQDVEIERFLLFGCESDIHSKFAIGFHHST